METKLHHTHITLIPVLFCFLLSVINFGCNFFSAHVCIVQLLTNIL